MAARSTRYFQNKLPDFVPGSKVQINTEFFKQAVRNYMDVILQRMPPTFENCDGGLYVGCAGVAYMFYYVANSIPFAEQRRDLLTKARNYIEVSLSYATSRHCRDPPAAFLLGGGGIYTVGSMVYHDNDDVGEDEKSEELKKKYFALLANVIPMNYLKCGSDELFVGRAGYICGALYLNKKFGEVVPVGKSGLNKVCNSIINAGRKYSGKRNSPSPLMYAYYDTEYLGAAHGVSAILQMVLCCPDFLKKNPAIEDEVHRSVDFMLGLLSKSGNIPAAMDEVQGHSSRPPSEELVHWCHGGPGIIYLFAKAFLYWNDPKYLQACLKIGECVWEKGLLKKGPGICHGVAGSGYVFLLLYRLTSDERHLHRAHKFAEFMFSQEFQSGARRPDCPFSLYEGIAGTVCFLTDLLQPQKAEFPLFDIFSF